MWKLDTDDTIEVLNTMMFGKGTCSTEREALENAICALKWKQEFEFFIEEVKCLNNANSIITRKHLPRKVFDILIEAAQRTKYGSKKFKLGETIKYRPTEVETILDNAIKEGDL